MSILYLYFILTLVFCLVVFSSLPLCVKRLRAEVTVEEFVESE